MVEININYEGDLRCHNTHTPSGNTVETDAPVDNNGRGESFSPTDLVATALGSCMATIMGIAANSKDLALEGMKIKSIKHMSEDLPRRISKIEITIDIPLPADHPERVFLEKAAVSCPVYQSIHPSIEVPIIWIWNS